MNYKFIGFDTNRCWDYENGFYLTSHITRISKLIAQYELYKSIIHLPGDVIECGVFKGCSFIRFCTYREILENPYSRKVIGFDTFGKFPRQNKHEAVFAKNWENDAGQSISKDELDRVLQFKGFKNYELIEGDIEDTVPRYATTHPALKIALLHIDVDIARPCKIILRHLYKCVVRGGLIIFDNYGVIHAETAAIDEFFKDMDVKLKKMPLSHVPAYLVKE
ncbi:hypothetical protein JCM13304A_21590 [Desulfothermus okinawensis JCM 13304]